MIDFNKAYDIYLNQFNNYLKGVFNSLDNSAPAIIREAMIYAVDGGGKRVRPILCIAVANLLGLSFDDVKEFALAIEIIHSYSLVHDDLPAMDNDDYRRGKLSTHKKFGEANGILAGDALLNFAFELCLNKDGFNSLHARALLAIAKCAGYTGMIGGQVLDLLSNDNNLNEEKSLYEIIEKKTSQLLIAPIIVPSILSGNKYFSTLNEYGLHLGYLFQITDDILDVEGTLDSIGKTPLKDNEVNKLTAVKLLGLDGAKQRATFHYNKCKDLISNINSNWFLSEFTDKIYKRKK